MKKYERIIFSRSYPEFAWVRWLRHRYFRDLAHFEGHDATWGDLGEGPFETAKDARRFGEAEVGVPWIVAKIPGSIKNPGAPWHILVMKKTPLQKVRECWKKATKKTIKAIRLRSMVEEVAIVRSKH